MPFMRKLKLTPSVMVDCSNANSRKNPLQQLPVLMDGVEQIRSGQDALCGVMLESYIKTGQQEISTAGKVIPGISVTDA